MSVYRVHNESIWGTKKYTYYVINTLNMFSNLEKRTPPTYLQLVKDKIFDLNLELYKAYLFDNSIISALKTVPRIYSCGNHQSMKNYLMATKIIAVSFIRKFIKKRAVPTILL